MYISKKASRARQREAQNARDNRAEIVKALSIGQITKRDLFKWGIYTTTGALALKNGLSPFARSAFADDIPTGTPRSPLGTATKFSQPMPRLALQTPYTLTKNPTTGNAVWPAALGERDSKRLSWHTDFTANPSNPAFRNPLNNRGPIEGRPPGEVFAHQRWDEFFPKVGYVMSWGQIQAGTKFHPGMTAQNPNAIWTYGPGRFVQGRLPPFLIKGRYGEPILTRIYNNTPLDRDPERGLRPQREPAASSQRAQWCGVGRRRQRASLPRHVLRLPLEHNARPPRHDQHGSDRQPRIRTERQWRPRQGRRRLPRAAGYAVGARSPLLLHRRERLQGQRRHGELLLGAGPRSTKGWSTASTCGCRAASCSTTATSTST